MKLPAWIQRFAMPLDALAKEEILRLMMSCLAVALVVITGPAQADCQAVRAAVIPLISGGRPIIEVSINGKAVRMLVDTGAQGSAVTPETVNELGLPRDSNRRTTVMTVGGQAVSRNVILEKLSFANIVYSNRSISVTALEGGMKEPAAGIIGSDVLIDFDVEFDFPQHTLTLYRPTGCTPIRPPWDGQYQTISASVSNRHQLLFPVELNGQSVSALFDTGSRGETVSRATANSIGITDAQLDNDPSTTGTSGQFKYATRRHRFDSLAVGTDTFHDIPLDVVDFHQTGVDIMVGADYMHWRRFFLSYSSGLLFIQKEQDEAIRRDLATRTQAGSVSDLCRPAPAILPTLALKPPVAVSRPWIDVPEKAQAEHINGCAAVMFHLAADGTPIDIKAVTESPVGYGFGELFARGLAATKFQPTATESKWYYEVHRFYGLQ